MNFKQINNVINQATHQMTGFENVENPLDAANIISLGNYVMNSATNRDAWFNVLSDVIGKTHIDDSPYSPDIKDLIYRVSEFGCVLRTIHTEPPEATSNPSWVPENNDVVGTWKIKKTDTTQKLFSNLDTWQVDISIPDIQLKSAFKDAESLQAFVASMMQAMENSMQMQLEAMASLCYSNFIAEKIIHYNMYGGLGLFNLLTKYNETHTPLTRDQAKEDKSFLKWMSKIINGTVKHLEKMSVLYNNDGFHRFNKIDDLRVIMLEEVASACKFYLESDTYHENLVKLPGYKEVMYWQGPGDDYGFDKTSKIFMNSSSGHVIEQTGVVCLISAKDAIGVLHDNRRTPADHDNNTETTTYHAKADMGYFNDLSQNGVVFVIADRVEPTMDITKPSNMAIAAGAAYELTFNGGRPEPPATGKAYRLSGDQDIVIINHNNTTLISNAPAADVLDAFDDGAIMYGPIGEGIKRQAVSGAYTASTKTILFLSQNTVVSDFDGAVAIYDTVAHVYRYIESITKTEPNQVKIQLTAASAGASDAASQQWYVIYSPIMV